jgi:hypothetical protein
MKNLAGSLLIVLALVIGIPALWLNWLYSAFNLGESSEACLVVLGLCALSILSGVIVLLRRSRPAAPTAAERAESAEAEVAQLRAELQRLKGNPKGDDRR